MGDMQASYLGLMFGHLTAKGIFVLMLSMFISSATSAYRLGIIVSVIPPNKETNESKYIGYGMMATLLFIVWNVVCKVFAAWFCTHHLFNLSQFGCYTKDGEE